MGFLVVVRPQVVDVVAYRFVDAFLCLGTYRQSHKPLWVSGSNKVSDNVRPMHRKVAPAATSHRRLLHTRWHKATARSKR